ncbi:WYL domain-containing protein [Aeromonas veronii]|uniref:WYL domain-containing protein n=1 Tax=Aeromonas veronii TaxID=654 RepID=UPI003D21F2E8
MGTFFALVAALCAVGSIVAAFKPSLIRLQSRFKAFVVCWMAAIALITLGSAFEGAQTWSSAIISLALLAGFYGIGAFIAHLIWLMRLSPEQRQARVDELKDKQARFKAERAAAKNGKPQLEVSIRYEDDRESRALKQSDSLQKFEDSLTVMWAGDTNPVEFTYLDFDGERTRRTVEVTEVSFNPKGQFYLRGTCQLRGEYRTFKVDNIQTMLKVGSKRYDFEGWCVEMLDILPSEGFPKAYFDRYDS